MNKRNFLIGTGSLLLEQLAYADNSKLPTKIPIYLTIDDGPTPFMKKIVDLLGDTSKATFFLVGKNMERTSGSKGMELAKYAVEKGHELGNHSYSHPWFSNLNLLQAQQQVERTRDLIEKVYAQCGRTAPLFFRFPFGDTGRPGKREPGKSEGNLSYKLELADLLKTMGYSTYYWSAVDYQPFSPLMKAGAVVLTHDWSNGHGVKISREYLTSNRFDLLPLPRPPVPQYEIR